MREDWILCVTTLTWIGSLHVLYLWVTCFEQGCLTPLLYLTPWVDWFGVSCYIVVLSGCSSSSLPAPLCSSLLAVLHHAQHCPLGIMVKTHRKQTNKCHLLYFSSLSVGVSMLASYLIISKWCITKACTLWYFVEHEFLTCNPEEQIQ